MTKNKAARFAILQNKSSSFYKIMAWKKVLINFPVKQNNNNQLWNSNKQGKGRRRVTWKFIQTLILMFHVSNI